MRPDDAPDAPNLEVDDPDNKPVVTHFQEVSGQAVRYRHVFTNRERFCIDGVMGGLSYAEIGRQLGGLTRHAVTRILAQAGERLPQPPRNNHVLRLVIWRAKEIGAVEAHLGLRDSEGNHIDDRDVLDGPAQFHHAPVAAVLAPRRLPARETPTPATSSDHA